VRLFPASGNVTLLGLFSSRLPGEVNFWYVGLRSGLVFRFYLHLADVSLAYLLRFFPFFRWLVRHFYNPSPELSPTFTQWSHVSFCKRKNFLPAFKTPISSFPTCVLQIMFLPADEGPPSRQPLLFKIPLCGPSELASFFRFWLCPFRSSGQELPPPTQVNRDLLLLPHQVSLN